MQFVKSPSDMGKTGGQGHAIIDAGAFGEPVVGRISGCIAFLTKPFSARSLIEPLKKASAGRS
jgi:hypothetical protein